MNMDNKVADTAQHFAIGVTRIPTHENSHSIMCANWTCSFLLAERENGAPSLAQHLLVGAHEQHKTQGMLQKRHILFDYHHV